MKQTSFFSLPVLVFLMLCGCAKSYVTPGPRADLAVLAPLDMREAFERKPSKPFPASIVAVRIQKGGYSNFNVERIGGVYDRGNFAVILVREVEQEEDFQRIQNLPEISNVIYLNRILIPDRVRDIDDLRLAASHLRADLLFVYTFDTAFRDHNLARPLSVISLGLAPTRKITATTTASALIIDTRTGFVYGALEATELNDSLSTSWGSREAADRARRANERAAFVKLVDEFAGAWPRILKQNVER
jgi:hypothetical protein